MTELHFDTLSVQQAIARICAYCDSCFGCYDFSNRSHNCTECSCVNVCKLTKNAYLSKTELEKSHGVCKDCIGIEIQKLSTELCLISTLRR